jgi:hypothetical protein
MNHAILNEVMAQIDAHLGRPAGSPSTVSSSKPPTTSQAAARSDVVLHVMFDLKSRSFVGASIGGKLLTGAVAAQLSKDGVALLDAGGENLLGANAGVAEQRGKADVSSQVAKDIYDLLAGARDEA